MPVAAQHAAGRGCIIIFSCFSCTTIPSSTFVMRDAMEEEEERRRMDLPLLLLLLPEHRSFFFFVRYDLLYTQPSIAGIRK